MARVVLAMSGGVDSSVAACLLRDAGHEVIGLFMRHGEPAPVACAIKNESFPADAKLGALPIVNPNMHKQGCCSAADADDARRVAERLGIVFYALNFESEFEQIIDYFVDEYSSGRTPNPCVMCNNWLKFGRICDYADSIGADYVATGHYAQLTPPASDDDFPALRRGFDGTKDQSYVLFGLDRGVLPRLLFPVGGYRKERIRELAHEFNLRVAAKRDSQEICFVPDNDHATFVRRRRGAEDLSGEIVLADGTVVGRHEGLEGFTIGQRKGLGVALGERRFVLRIERDTRRVVIGTRDELARGAFTAERANWLIDEPSEPLHCDVQIRYNSVATPATVLPLGKGRFRVEFDEPRHGIAPGQAAVCYHGDHVLGGGWIE
ncbi:MAG: tRNA 2-thiouridine(34) synthase MnmA [Pirellulales bacterium]|nr:tRNA 2-thiouridine(34) synthase MnmA [Pirellulales bacterium]